jgi:hypothetical protein
VISLLQFQVTTGCDNCLPQVGEEWVSKGWNELDHKGWLFKAVQRPALNEAAHNQLSQDMVGTSLVVFLPPETPCIHSRMGMWRLSFQL